MHYHLYSETKNPIYYFYKRIDQASDGTVGNVGDQHYKCYHGGQKIITLKKASKLVSNWFDLYPVQVMKGLLI